MASEVCMIEGCERKSASRGLCWPCYQMASKRINAGDTTWDELVSVGLAKAVKRSGFNTKSPFSNAFMKFKEKVKEG